MGYKEFGRLVRSLRQERTFYTAGGIRQWSQEWLANKTQISGTSGLSVKQVADVENGRVANIKTELHIEPLARAFELSEAEKTEFYAEAGYLYQPENSVVSTDFLVQLLSSIPFPAGVRNSLWDFIAFNQFNYALYGYTRVDLNTFTEGPIGPNLLRILFDPMVSARFRARDPQQWQEERIRDLQAFRATSLRHKGSPRYQLIVETMQQFPDFQKLWNISEHIPNAEWGLPVRPTITVSHPEFGDMSFISLRVPRAYLGEDLRIAVYVPLRNSVENFKKLSSTIEQNDVYLFDTNETGTKQTNQKSVP